MKAIQTLLTDSLDIWSAAETGKKSGRGRSSINAASVYGIRKLRELILELAVRGKLVLQDASDEPASALLKRIQAEKARLIAEGKIRKDKPLAAIAPEDKPFELPHGWEWAKLGFIGYTQTGTTPSKSSAASFGSDIPFVKPGDIYPNHVEYSNEGLSFYGAEQSGRIAQSGSILMVCIGTIGKCNLIERNCSFNQQINSVTPYVFSSHYLLSVCRSVYFYTEAWSRSSSTTIAILNKGNWEEICIPVPPIEEQHRIVAKVDELMALCDQLETRHGNAAEGHEKLVSHLLATLTQSQSAEDFAACWQRIAAHFDTLFATEASIDALKQTLLQLAVRGKLVLQDASDEPASALLKRIQAEKARLIAEGKIRKDKPLAAIAPEDKPFELPHGWEWAKLGFIGYTQTGTTPSKSSAASFGSDIPFVKPGDIYPNHVEYSNEGLSFYGAEQSGRIAQSGSILMVCIGTIGKCNLIERNCSFNQQINSVTPYVFSSHYLLSVCRSVYFYTEAWSRSSSTTIAILNKGNWEEICIPVPPIEEQHRIVAKVDELMTLCEQLKYRIAHAHQCQQNLADVLTERAIE